MKEAYRCVYMEDAIVVKSLLDSAGVESKVLSGDMMDVNPFFSVTVQGIRIIVADEDYEDALSIVNDYKTRRED